MKHYHYTLNNPVDYAGEKLDYLLQKLKKYLEKKKAAEPVSAGGLVTYVLRNGLKVDYARETVNTLDLFVSAEEDGKVKKSIEAIKKVYEGNVILGSIIENGEPIYMNIRKVTDWLFFFYFSNIFI